MISAVELDPRLPAAFGANWPAIHVAEWVIMLADIAICLFLALRLCSVRRWSSVRLTIAGIWISVFLVLLFESFAVAVIAGIPLSQTLGAKVTAIFQGLVYCVFWTSYLLRSKRVANTYHRYGSNDELETVSASFPCHADLLQPPHPRGACRANAG